MVKTKSILTAIVLFSILCGCNSPEESETPLPTLANASSVDGDGAPPTLPPIGAVPTVTAPATATPTPLPITPTPFPTYVGVPTPDPPHPVITKTGDNTVIHVVAPGETLSLIAEQYDADLEAMLKLNEMEEDALLYVGQQLLAPFQIDLTSSNFKIMPNSELIYGPRQADFKILDTLILYNSGLLRYGEQVEGQTLSGAEIFQLIADRFLINPRLLLAVAEYQAGLVTAPTTPDDPYLLGYDTQHLTGLYWQLARISNLLNAGYYGWLREDYRTIELDDETLASISPQINAGTVAAQTLFANVVGADQASWEHDLSPDGFFAAYQRLFGNPFAYTVEPLLPETLTQPPLQLPWEAGESWYFTGGPHGGFGWGSPWAALDFVPAGEQLGCSESAEWTTAMADGVVVRSGFGGVVIDLDGDGYAGTGWTLHYLHIANDGRVTAGARVKAGDRIGHPSCEGGFSNGTHIHIARAYNGHWLDAGSETPFNLSGWQAQGLIYEYDGMLIKGEDVREACECREEFNAVLAEQEE